MAVADTSKESTTATTTLSTSARRAAAPPPDLLIPKNLWRDRGKSTTHTAAAAPTSPERNRVWTEPSPKPRRVAVVYYLSRRNGHLDHPHFMEVPLSSPDGLYLRDVMHRLNLLRGTGMAALYSWSAKRSYKGGFVWQDLAENDFIYPSHGNEYVLKGSELLHDAGPPLPPFSSFSSSSRPLESVSFRSPKLTEVHCDESNFPSAVPRWRRNQSWSSIDLHEYKVYKTESPGLSAQRPAANASTQTDDRRRRGRRQVREVKEEVTCHDLPKKKDKEQEGETTELTRDEITPPPSDSSPETLEKLMKADKRLVLSTSAASSNNALPAEDGLDRAAPENHPSGRMRASSVLMQLISCGSFSFKDCGASYVKDQRLSIIGHYKPRLHRRAGTDTDTDTNSSCNPWIAGASGEISSFSGIKLEDKEYFSGSLLETAMNKRPELIPILKRSSSYNEDRTSSQVQLGEKDAKDDGARARCVPRKLRMQPVITGRLEQGNVAAVAASSSSQVAGQE